ncbi:MAG: autotransporter domain-containing protein [Verrucomicrobiota bacterium]|nr:autotransporter domain-containing protein [Verrucomicrobiota bacterium]
MGFKYITPVLFIASFAVFGSPAAQAQCVVDGDATPVSCDGDGGDNTIQITGAVNENVGTGAGNDTVKVDGSMSPPATVEAITNSSGNLTVNGSGPISTSDADAIADDGTGSASVDGVNITVTGTGDAINEDDEGDVTVNNATISADTGDGVHEDDDGSVTVDNSTIINNTGEAVYENNEGSVTVTNSTLTTSDNEALYENNEGSVTVTNSTLTTSDDEALYENNEGSVTVTNSILTTSDDEALYENNEGSVTVTNSTLTTSDDQAIFENNEGSVTVTNSTLTTSDNQAIFENNEGDVTVTDSTLTTSDDQAIFENNEGDVTVTNSTLTTVHDQAIFENNEGDVTVTNSTLTTSDDQAIFENNEGDVIVTRSTLTTSGGHGIDTNSSAAGDGGVQIMYSTVTTSGLDYAALDYSGDGNELNFMKSRLTGDHALNSMGTDNLFNVGILTIFDGDIVIDSADNAFHFGDGYSGALFMDDAVPGTITSDGNPFATSGSLIAVADRTGFAMQDDIASELGRLISGALPLGYHCMRSHRDADLDDDSLTCPNHQGLWATPFGAHRDTDASHLQGFDQTSWGVMGGFDGDMGGNGRLGGFLGGAWANSDSDYDLHSVESQSFFFGLYGEKYKNDVLWSGAITAGFSDYDTMRWVNNNSVAGGVEYLNGDLDSFFIMPEISATKVIPEADGLTLEASLSYLGFFFDGFTESGAVGLTVDDRELHLVIARGEATLPIHLGNQLNDPNSNLEIFGAVEGQFRLDGDGINGSLVGVPVLFNSGTDDSVGALFAGMRLSHKGQNGAKLSAEVEFGYDTQETFAVRGNIGVVVPF